MSAPGYFIQVMNGGGPTTYAAAHARYYYGALTYQRPNVKLLALPNPVGGILRIASPGGSLSNWPSASGIILKRTSATNYVMVRWNAATDSQSPTWHDLEIVVNNTGAGEVVRSSVSTGTQFYQPALLIAWLDAGNVVHAQVVDPNTSLVGSYPTLLSTSYQLSSAEITALGAGVAGAAGIVQVLSFNTQLSGLFTSGAVCKYTATRDDITPVSASAVVMGDVDTPPRLMLAGDLVNPLVTVSTPDGQSSVLQFADTFAQANPVFIDFDQGTVVDSAGANRFGGLQSGSSMRNLQPGINTVSIQAQNWTTGLQHLVAWWRDARK